MADETDPEPDEGLRDRMSRQGEDVVGRIAQELLDSQVVQGAINRLLEARERASQAQDLALGALNLPSASDLERLTRRVRSVSLRLEGIEDGVDRLDRRLEAGAEARLAAIEERLAQVAADVAAIRAALPDAPAPVARDQERLEVAGD